MRFKIPMLLFFLNLGLQAYAYSSRCPLHSLSDEADQALSLVDKSAQRFMKSRILDKDSKRMWNIPRSSLVQQAPYEEEILSFIHDISSPYYANDPTLQSYLSELKSILEKTMDQRLFNLNPAIQKGIDLETKTVKKTTIYKKNSARKLAELYVYMHRQLCSDRMDLGKDSKYQGKYFQYQYKDQGQNSYFKEDL